VTGALPSGADAGFDPVLTGRATRLVRDDGIVLPLEPARWNAPADAADGWVLDRCTGSTLDLGCGPGRLVGALADRGIPALGVDSSPVARVLCRRRGAPMVRADVFGPLPGEGAWAHVLLVDGNIGIGGDPVRLLRRAARLLAAGGTVLVETAPEPDEWWAGTVRTSEARTDIPWACLGTVTLRMLAPRAGLWVRTTVTTTATTGPRCFAELASG
jgi:SAM-dependent methyltransferase